MSNADTKVVVAMSGGVDSSVAVALLVEQGYEVIGMMLRLWSEPGCEDQNRCCTPDAMERARRVAAQLDIPFYAVDAKIPFREIVVQYFLDGYTEGITPNPCLMCNRHIRWEFLLNQALSSGADYMATGHYARLLHEPGQPVRLLRGVDTRKDQSYVLSVLNQQQLARTLLPVGGYTKPEIRQIAERFKLPAARVKDSQDLCFLAGGDYAGFLQRHAPQSLKPGPIKTSEGEVLGEHRGLAFYTIGQRKGLGIAAPEPRYVLDKDVSSNTLVVGRANELGRDTLMAGAVNWLSGEQPVEPLCGEIKIRYTSGFTPGLVTPLDETHFSVKFDRPVRDITPGQAAVVFVGDEVIASGIIEGADTPAGEPNPVRLIERER
jgi:tRNA-specific 2-thiouridylase